MSDGASGASAASSGSSTATASNAATGTADNTNAANASNTNVNTNSQTVASQQSTEQQQQKADSKQTDTSNDIAKQLESISKELSEYKAKEKAAADEKLKADGKFQELLTQKDAELTELKKQLSLKERKDGLRGLFTEKKIDNGLIGGKTLDVISSDDSYFDTDHKPKKNAFDLIVKDFPALQAKPEPAANVPFDLNSLMSSQQGIEAYTNQKIKEFSDNKAYYNKIVGANDIIDLMKN